MRSKNKKKKAKVGRQYWKIKEKDDACKVIVPVEEFFSKTPSDGKWRPKEGVAPRNIWKKVRAAAPGGTATWEDGDIYIGHGSKWAEFNLVRKT